MKSLLKATLTFLLTFGFTIVLQAASSEPFETQWSSQPEVEKRVETLLKKMTLEEKIDYIGGFDGFYVRAIPRLGLPAFKMSDGPIGVRNYGPSTAYAAGIGLAASWDRDLAGRVGAMIGKDARARGVHFMLGPGVNIYRAPMNGRNFEYFGEDPFLASRMVVAYVKGMQEQGVSATVKHYMGNNSEVDRHNSSSDMDERTMREIYLPTFEAAVKEAHVGAIMNSYNLVNGVHATQNDFLNNQLAKKEWGFDGVMMSDWGATYDGVAVANAGLDLEMPEAKFMNRETLLPAIKDGKVTEEVINDKVRRILRTAVRMGWLDREQTDPSLSLYSEEGRKLALESAQGSIVLLKNQGNLLPLDGEKIHSLAVIGPDAYPAVPVGGGSAQVKPFQSVSYIEGLSHCLSGAATVYYSRGSIPVSEICDMTEFVTLPKGGEKGLQGEYFDNPDLSGKPALTQVDWHVNNFWNWQNHWPTGGKSRDFSARWAGYFIPSTAGEYRFLASAWSWGSDDYRLYVDGKLVLEKGKGLAPITQKVLRLQAGKAYALKFEFLHHGGRGAKLSLGIRRADQFLEPNVKSICEKADAVVVAVGFDPDSESEGSDRTFQLPQGQDDLIAMARAVNKNTIVVVTSGGGVDMSRWVDQVPAVLEAWYPGQEGGLALAQVLTGEVNPSGKLPAGFERKWEDSAVYNSYYPDADKHIKYSEGVFLGYRHFDQSKVKPLFPFGYGLSYTTFKYENLVVGSAAGNNPVTLSFDVTNSGSRAGAEVAEVYVAPPTGDVPRPLKELKEFAKVSLKPGENKRMSVTLNRRAFSYFDVKTKSWKTEPGDYGIWVGPSSDRMELKGKVTLP